MQHHYSSNYYSTRQQYCKGIELYPHELRDFYPYAQVKLLNSIVRIKVSKIVSIDTLSIQYLFLDTF